MVSLPLKFIRSTSKIFYVSSLKKSFRHHFRFANIFCLFFFRNKYQGVFFIFFFLFSLFRFIQLCFCFCFEFNTLYIRCNYTLHNTFTDKSFNFFYFLWFFFAFRILFFFIYWKKNQTKTIIFHFSLVDFLFWLGSIRHSMFQNNPSVWSIVVCA